MKRLLYYSFTNTCTTRGSCTLILLPSPISVARVYWRPNHRHHLATCATVTHCSVQVRTELQGHHNSYSMSI